ncbi:magnesium transporter NIPA-domain-containing protein [Tirmania nivea]|nr:magnesium transporter NIPA-domain-containing protein [Tirmania nivea]
MDGTVETSYYLGHQSVFSSPSSTTTPYASQASPSGGIYSNPTDLATNGATIQWILSLMGSDGDEDEAKRWSSFIGIIVAIGGNVLISLALNVQKYAHIRLRREKTQRKQLLKRRRKEQAWKRALAEMGSVGQRGDMVGEEMGDDDIGQLDGDETPEDEEPETTNEHSNLVGGGNSAKGDQMYLHSPWWWLGLVLMTVGECGNFLAYGFAPASIVSPLGVVALISNCIVAPLMLKEPFRGRDFVGVVVSITGAVIVVMSSAAEEVKLGPDEILEAISRTAFEIYFGVTCLMIGALMYISQRYGSKSIVIDLGLVALFGGYTVLSTKGISSLLTTSLYHIFTMPIAYLFAVILISTAILQIKYVNRALQRFDSTQVIPTQFVLFTLSVIIGSGILYRDFEKIDHDRLTKFTFGCGFTFSGVYLITSGRVTKEEDEDDQLAEEGCIGLLEGEGISEVSSQNGSMGRQRVATFNGADGAASPRATRARPLVRRYQSSHSVAVTVASNLDLPHESDITETSPLLEHHADYHDSPPSSLHSPARAGFSHSSTNLTTSTTIPQRHSISLVPGPIVLGYQLQAVVADHVGPAVLQNTAKRAVRKVKSITLDMSLPPKTAPGSSCGFGEGSSRRPFKEPDSAGGEDEIVSGLEPGEDTGKSKGRGRSSSLHLVMDYVKVSSPRRVNGSVSDTTTVGRAGEEEP